MLEKVLDGQLELERVPESVQVILSLRDSVTQLIVFQNVKVYFFCIAVQCQQILTVTDILKGILLKRHSSALRLMI